VLAGNQAHQEDRPKVVDRVEVCDRNGYIARRVLHRFGPGARRGVRLDEQSVPGNDRAADHDQHIEVRRLDLDAEALHLQRRARHRADERGIDLRVKSLLR